MFKKYFLFIQVTICFFSLFSGASQAYNLKDNTREFINSNFIEKSNNNDVFSDFRGEMSVIISSFNAYLSQNTQFIADNTIYENYRKNFEEIAKKQKQASLKIVEKNLYVDNQLNTYQIKSISDSEVTIKILNKISGKTGPEVAAGMYQIQNKGGEILETIKDLESESKPEDLSKTLEILIQGGQENKTLLSIILPTDIDLSEINKFLQPFVDQNLITPLQAEGWLKTEILSRLREFKQAPDNFELGSLVGEKIGFNGISTDLYQRTGIVTVEQNKKKANVVLFSLISLNGEDPSSVPDPDKGVEKVLAYARNYPPSSSELNSHRIQSPYSNAIRNAKNLVELTQILNQSGHGQGLQLDPTILKDREWIYGSVEQKSPYYLGKLYGKEPTSEQLRTALHIKEWLRASGISYLHNELKITNEQDLANAIDTRINNIHPDVANYLAQYLFEKVSNPYCKDNGFCSDLNEIATESSIVVRVVSPAAVPIPASSPTVSLPPEVTKPENTYYYPDPEDKPQFFGGAMAGGGAGGGAGGAAGGGALIALVTTSKGQNKTSIEDQSYGDNQKINIVPHPLEIPEPNSPVGLLTFLLLLLKKTKSKQQE